MNEPWGRRRPSPLWRMYRVMLSIVVVLRQVAVVALYFGEGYGLCVAAFAKVLEFAVPGVFENFHLVFRDLVAAHVVPPLSFAEELGPALILR